MGICSSPYNNQNYYVRNKQMQKIFIIIGVAFIAIGVLLPWLTRFGLGHMPGDIIIKKNNFTFYFPVITCAILSIIITLFFGLFQNK